MQGSVQEQQSLYRLYVDMAKGAVRDSPENAGDACTDPDVPLATCKPKGRKLSSSALLHQNETLHSHFS